MIDDVTTLLSAAPILQKQEPKYQKYVFGEFGITECPEHYKPISEEKDCNNTDTNGVLHWINGKKQGWANLWRHS